MKISDFNSSTSLYEVRNPNWEYATNMTKKVGGVIKNIYVKLSGTDSSVLTRISNEYVQLYKLAKEIEAKRSDLNEKLTDIVEGSFDPEDRWHTRIIETVSLTLTLAKESKDEGEPEQVDTDWESVANDLLKLLKGDLIPMGQNIVKLYTTITPAVAPDPNAEVKKPALRVKVKESEILLEDKAKLEKLFKEYEKLMNHWALKYDSKLSNLRNRLAA